jgi:integrase
MQGVASLALQFLILTAARPRDVRAMLWSEIDSDGAIWELPAERSNTRTVCRIPLARPALRLLEALPHTGPRSEVFTTLRPGQGLSDMSLTAVLRRMNDQRRARGLQPWTDSTQGTREIVPAGFRETFRSWAAQTQEHVKGARYLLSGSPRDSEETIGQASSVQITKRTLEAWARHCRQVTKP